MTETDIFEYSLDNRVRAFSTTRKGGVSTGNYSSFNISHYCNDRLKNVQENRNRLSLLLDIPSERIIVPRQVHLTAVQAVTSHTKNTDLEDIDAVITNERQLCIGISTADCVPILLYDTTKQAIGAVHAGWRGTVGKIVCKTIQKMQEHYNSFPQDLKAIIGPSISKEAFEVGDEVYDAFATAGFTMSEIAERREKWHIDLWAANFNLLVETGVEMENISVANICTNNDYDTFFSARRLGINSGRIYTGILLK